MDWHAVSVSMGVVAVLTLLLSEWSHQREKKRKKNVERAETAPPDSIAGIYWKKALMDEDLVNSATLISSDELVRRYVRHWTNAMELPFTDLRSLSEQNLIKARHKWQP